MAEDAKTLEAAVIASGMVPGWDDGPEQRILKNMWVAWLSGRETPPANMQPTVFVMQPFLSHHQSGGSGLFHLHRMALSRASEYL